MIRVISRVSLFLKHKSILLKQEFQFTNINTTKYCLPYRKCNLGLYDDFFIKNGMANIWDNLPVFHNNGTSNTKVCVSRNSLSFRLFLFTWKAESFVAFQKSIQFVVVESITKWFPTDISKDLIFFFSSIISYPLLKKSRKENWKQFI